MLRLYGTIKPSVFIMTHSRDAELLDEIFLCQCIPKLKSINIYIAPFSFHLLISKISIAWNIRKCL